jgi:hypothetical protein
MMQPKSLSNNHNCCKVVTIVTDQACGLASAHACRDEVTWLHVPSLGYPFGRRGSQRGGEKESVTCPQGNKQHLVYPGISMLKRLKYVTVAYCCPNMFSTSHTKHIRLALFRSVMPQTNGGSTVHSLSVCQNDICQSLHTVTELY